MNQTGNRTLPCFVQFLQPFPYFPFQGPCYPEEATEGSVLQVVW